MYFSGNTTFIAAADSKRSCGSYMAGMGPAACQSRLPPSVWMRNTGRTSGTWKQAWRRRSSLCGLLHQGGINSRRCSMVSASPSVAQGAQADSVRSCSVTEDCLRGQLCEGQGEPAGVVITVRMVMAMVIHTFRIYAQIDCILHDACLRRPAYPHALILKHIYMHAYIHTHIHTYILRLSHMHAMYRKLRVMGSSNCLWN